jgi:hypothetical protein
MIKNFLVKTQQIRQSGTKYKYKKILTDGKTRFEKINGTGRVIKNGFVNHVNYLKDASRAAHQNTDIHIILNNAKNILAAINDRKAERRSRNIRGGGVVNYATSFVMSLPSEIQPSIEQWTKIGERLINDIAKTTNIDASVIKKHTHIVLHAEDVTGDKHSHIHVLVSNVIDCVVVRKISQRVTTAAIKTGFNESVKQLLNIDHNNYTPKRSGVADKPLWLARQEKLKLLETESKNIEQELIQKKIKLTKINQALTLLADSYIKVKNDLTNWAYDFINQFWIDAEIKAKLVTDSIELIEKQSKSEANKLDHTVKSIEKKHRSAPEKTKVSSERKRRRRKKTIKNAKIINNK